MEAVKGFIADTSSLILLNKAELMDLFSSAFFVIAPESVRQEFICQGEPPAWFSQLKFLPINTTADSDVISVLESDGRLALLSDDKELIMKAHKMGRCYLSAIVCISLLFFHGQLSRELGGDKMISLCELGYYSPFVVSTAEQFLKNQRAMPLWMKHVVLKTQVE